MNTDTTIAKNIRVTDEKASYDAACKPDFQNSWNRVEDATLSEGTITMISVFWQLLRCQEN